METYLITGIATLSLAVVALYTRLELVRLKTDKKLEECESDRETLWERVMSLESIACADRECGERRPHEINLAKLNPPKPRTEG